MSIIRPVSRGMLAALAAVVVLVVVGAVAIAANVGSSPRHHQQVSSGSTPVPAASFHVAGVHNGHAPAGKKLRVRVVNGALSSVVVKPQGQRSLAGKLNKTRTTWTSRQPLAASSHLTASIRYVDLAHQTTDRTLTFSTPNAKARYNAIISPANGSTVGIGSPVIVTFDRAVPTSRRAAVERALTVTSKPAVIGAWHWMSDQEVHWRPPTYWKTGTKVTVTSALQGVSLGHGVYGAAGLHSTSFRIGAAHISEANQATHEMKIYDNGKLIKTFPISTGRGQYPTMDGVHIALEKTSVIEMNSATVGIPKGNPDYYDETVYWDVRISNGGEFVHAAPWSVGEQGHENVSHGCVNLSTANAEWFYNWAQNGDVVDIYNGVRPPEAGDAGTADWNMSWKQWLAGGAAPSAAAKALHPRLPRDSEPGFGPHKHVAKKRAVNKHHASKHASKQRAAKKHVTPTASTGSATNY